MPIQKVEKYKIAKGLEISRAITGLWQIADMEKDGNTLDHGALCSIWIIHI
jgi:hypothetical protein